MKDPGAQQSMTRPRKLYPDPSRVSVLERDAWLGHHVGGCLYRRAGWAGLLVFFLLRTAVRHRRRAQNQYLDTIRSAQGSGLGT